MLKSVPELSYFTRKTSVKKKIFLKFQRAFISDQVVVLISISACLEAFKCTLQKMYFRCFGQHKTKVMSILMLKVS